MATATLGFVQKNRIEKYLRAVNPSQNELEKVNKLIGAANLGIELRVRNKLLTRRAQLMFPELDPCFLSMHRSAVKMSLDIHCLDKRDYWQLYLTTPQFAVHNLSSPIFEIHGKVLGHYVNVGKEWIEVTGEPRTEQVIPGFMMTEIAKAFSYVAKRTNKIHDGEIAYNWRISNYLELLLPTEIKDLIDQETSSFEGLYLIVEANWALTYTAKDVTPVASGGGGAAAPSPDPLLVGVRDGRCFLLREFDCTLIEAYVAKEFIK